MNNDPDEKKIDDKKFSDALLRGAGLPAEKPVVKPSEDPPVVPPAEDAVITESMRKGAGLPADDTGE